MISSDKYKSLFPQKPYTMSAFIMNEHLRIYPNDEKALYVLRKALISSVFLDDESILLLEKIVNNPANQDIANRATLALSEGCYYNKSYVKARKYAHKIINSCKDKMIVQKARNVILSIDMK